MGSTLPGKLASLSSGDLYYLLRDRARGDSAAPSQAEEAPLVVTLHGFACGMLSLDSLASLLADDGFRVLSYDFYGVGGHSDAPDASYTMEFFVDTIQELLEAIGFGDARLYLVGYSMGCGVAAGFAARHPEKTDRVVLLDPVHGPVEFLGQVVHTPVVGAVVGKVAALVEGCELLVKHLEKEYHHPEWPHVAEMMDRQFELIRWTDRAKPNLVSAAIKMVQNFPFPDLIDSYRELGGCGREIPTQVVWGDLSKYYPRRADVAQAIPFAAEEVIEDAGHMLFAEKPDQMNALVRSFLNASSERRAG